MVITYRTINKVRFPVFRLGSSNWDEQDGLLFIENKLLDDKNMPGDSLGKRRLQTPFKDLYYLRYSIDNLIGIIKQTQNAFIDSEGMPFIYEKSISCPLQYYKIRKIEQKTRASVLWVKGINFPFTIPRPPDPDMSWAGVLHMKSIPWMLYEYSENKKSDTRRKV